MDQYSSDLNALEIIKEMRKDLVHRGTCHPAVERMTWVLKEHTNVYGEDEPEDFGRKRNKKAEIVFLSGEWVPTGKMRLPLRPWMLWI